MPGVPARLAAFTLVLVFAWAVAAKALAWDLWTRSLAGYRLPPLIERAARILVPVMEAAVVVAGVALSIKVEAALVMFLLGGFSIAVVRARALEGDRLPCGCFGGRKERNYRTFLIRNAALALLAAVVLADPNDAALVSTIEAPSLSDLVPVALTAIGLGLAGWVAWSVSTNLRHRP